MPVMTIVNTMTPSPIGMPIVVTPSPSAYACAGCPALDRVCAGPALVGAEDGGFVYDPSLEPDGD